MTVLVVICALREERLRKSVEVDGDDVSLYSLEGALRGRHWDALGSKIKQRLLSQLSPIKPSQRA